MSKTENQNKELEITFLNGFWMWFKLQKEIKSGKANSQTYVHLAEIYLNYFMNRLALKNAFKAIKLDKTNPEAYYLAGLSKSCLNKDFSFAEKYFIKAINLGMKQKYIPLAILALKAFQDGDFEKAFDYKKQVLSINEETSVFYFMCTYVYIQSFMLKESLESFFKVIKYSILERKLPLQGIFFVIYFFLQNFIANDFYKNYCRAYYLLYSGESKEEGEKLLLEIAEKHKKYKESCYDSLFVYYYEREDYKKCIDIANKILIKDKYWKVYEYKKLSYLALGQEDKVIKVIKSMQKNNIQTKEEEDYNIQLGKIYFKRENYSKALNYFNKQIISSPSSHPFLYKGMCLERLSDYENAIKAYNTSLDYEKSDLAYYRVANLYYQEKDYQKALENINNGLLLNKDSYNYNLKGDILTAMLRIKEARICYKKAENLG